MMSLTIRYDPTTRAPGQHTRAIVKRLRLRTLVSLGVLAVATAMLGRAFGLRDLRFIGSEIALLAAMFVVCATCCRSSIVTIAAPPARSRSAACWTGSAGEGWHVIHDASLGHGNVDHILIGPAGVFTVETKSHPGPVRVARVHGATLSQAQAQRKAIARVTGVEVEPLLVYSRAWVDRPLARRKGVRVLPARMLAGYLDRHRATLSPEEVTRAREQVVVALHDHRARGSRRRP